jgi:Domain of unknown function (DUF3387)
VPFQEMTARLVQQFLTSIRKPQPAGVPPSPDAEDWVIMPNQMSEHAKWLDGARILGRDLSSSQVTRLPNKTVNQRVLNRRSKCSTHMIFQEINLPLVRAVIGPFTAILASPLWALRLHPLVRQENGKDRYLGAVRELSHAFALAVPHDEALRIRDDVAFFQAVQAIFAQAA